MIWRVEVFYRRMRRWLSRNEWAIRLFGLSRSQELPHAPGLVIVQVDGLARTQLERALQRGRMPFLQSLIRRERYRLHTMYSGLPSSTPAVQAELFYGVKGAVPAFSFRDASGQIVRMFDPVAVAALERELADRGEPLLKGGAAYSDIFTGGAAESHFCASAIGLGAALRGVNPFNVFLVFLTHLYSFARIFVLLILELILAIRDFFQGVVAGHDLGKELKFVPTRVAICVLLRELVTIGAKMDITRGLPIIHVNFLGYDEQSHRRGPRARFAHWVLKGIDDAIARIWREAHGSDKRHYHVWIYSDHGQEESLPYPSVHGRSIEQAVQAAFERTNGAPGAARDDRRGVQSHRVNLLGAKRAERLLPVYEQGPAAETAGQITVAAMGPIGLVYAPQPLDPEQRDSLARALTEEAHIPLVLARDGPGRLQAYTSAGTLRLPEDRAAVLGADHPFLDEVTTDLIALCELPSAGDLVICGWRDGTPHYTFPQENGAHGGIGSEETRPFALLPGDTRLPARTGEALRPSDLRAAALHELRRGELPASSREPHGANRPLRIMTYNVHSCRGMDGIVSPERIARVIAAYEPDVVALQELDVGRGRTGSVDQARLIAQYLKMEYHFHPTIRVEEELYGDALLTHLPMRLVKAGQLPGHPRRPRVEPRGALWAAITVGDLEIQVINTHLGLYPAERLAQIEALLGEEWLTHPSCKRPVVLCGDLNAAPSSAVCRRIGAQLRDAQLHGPPGRPKNTWFGRYPTLRIDHIFVDAGVEVIGVDVPHTALAQVASDHLPLIAEVRLQP